MSTLPKWGFYFGTFGEFIIAIDKSGASPISLYLSFVFHIADILFTVVDPHVFGARCAPRPLAGEADPHTPLRLGVFVSASTSPVVRIAPRASVVPTAVATLYPTMSPAATAP